MKKIDIQTALNNFPFPTFRKYQKEKIEEITEAFESGYQWVLLETPPGFGKSPINVAFCRIMRSFYLTPQNMLIDQLHGDFPDMALIKGRRHYPCPEGGENCGDDAPCKKDFKYDCYDKYSRCPYWIAKIEAINAQTALTNFAYFVGESFTHGNPFIPHFGNRELVIIDEGHSIDAHILNHISLTVNSRVLPYQVYQDVKGSLLELPKRLNVDEINILLSGVASSCEWFLDGLPSKLNKDQVKDMERAERFISKVEGYHEKHDADWVGQTNRKDYSRGVWVEAKIQPIFVARFMHDYLWRRAKRFIVSSATIFRNDFMKECGLNDHAGEVWHTHAPSTFPIQNRMIVDAAAGSLSWAKRSNTLPNALQVIKKILTIEPGKGVIHAHSYAFADAIANGIWDPRLLFHESRTRDETLEEFLDSPVETGRVLVAVAMTEGLDLVGDLATFQILLKCPYANFADDLRVGRRLKELHHNRWYAVQTLKTIVQSYGRAVRGPTDRAAFYIIDSDVNMLCKRWRRQLPRFFKEAYDLRKPLA